MHAPDPPAAPAVTPAGSVRARRLSTRHYVLLLVLAVMVPVLMFSGFLIWRYAISEQARIELDLRGDARQLAQAIDRDLAGLEVTLQTLAISGRVQDGDYAGFYEQMQRVRSLVGIDLILRDVSGQQLANTQRPFGAVLPLTPLAGDKEVIETKQPFVSDVLFDVVTGAPIYSITVPVIQGNRVTHFLNLSASSQRIVDLISPRLEDGGRAGVVGGHGLILARSERNEAFSGRPASPDFLANAQGLEGLWRGVNTSGEAVRTAYARSRLANWIVYVNTSENRVQALLSRALWAVGGVGIVLTILSLGIAYLFGGRLSRASEVLTAQAAALGRGEIVPQQRMPVRELGDVGREMAAASIALRTRERERDKAEQELRRLSEMLERNVADRTSDLVAEMRRREETEGALRQAQKMEAIGQLTGGIAHDFNNMLAIVLGGLEMCQRRLARGEPLLERHIDTAIAGARRAASLTARLLAFARQQPLMPEALDANRLLADMSDLLRRSLGETIELETVLAAGLWRTVADPNQLENAILNLAVNARDAMGEGGKLTIETANTYLDDDYAARAGVKAGQFVMFAVTDTGVGMTSEVIAKAFDPFFTTKSAGLGTGLGLSQVYGFVRQSDGHVSIYSEPGHGTTIKIYLPRSLAMTPGEGDAAEGRDSLPAGDPRVTILVVEDEEGVRKNTTEALRELGYSVLDADGGTAALAVLEKEPPVTLLFTDVVMPGMNGRKLADEVLRRWPATKVLFTTGYTRNAIVHNAVLDAGVHVIPKPFTLDALARKVAEVLRTPTPS
ncbi:MAG: ATP-binding protein [Variibacter sp.]